MTSNYFPGKVGIGTQSPVSALDLYTGTMNASTVNSSSVTLSATPAAAANVLTVIGSSSTGNVVQFSTTAGVNFIITSSGRIGIGTTNPGCALGFAPNVVNKVIALYDGNPTDPVATATNFFGFGINGSILRYQVPSGQQHVFYNAGTASMTIDGNGRVGIGTQSPVSALDLYTGTMNASTVNSSSVTLSATPAAAANVLTVIGSSSTGNVVQFSTTAGGTFIMTKDGRVGIGTASPASPLAIQCADSYRGGVTLGSAAAGAADPTDFMIQRGPSVNAAGGSNWNSSNCMIFHTANETNATTGPVGYLWMSSNSRLGMFYDARNSRLGIGTTTPAVALQVNSDSHGIRQTNGTVSIEFYIGSSAGWVGTFSNHPLYFFTNNGGSPNMAITTAGNVGIGTLSPVSPLTVQGADGFQSGITLGTNAGNASGPGEFMIQRGTSGLFSGFNASNCMILHTANETTATSGPVGCVWVSSGSRLGMFYDTRNSRLGIGTTNPGYQMDMYNASPTTLRILTPSQSSGTAGASIRLMEANDTYGFSFQNINSSRLGIFRHSASSTGSEIISIMRDNTYVGIGTANPGVALDVVGNVRASADSSFNGVSIGKGTGTAPSSTVVGQNAMLNNTTGDYNTAVGAGTLQLNTSGYYNTAVGYAAIYNNTTGYYNTAVGYGALNTNTIGLGNTAVGGAALNKNSNGINNTAVGYNALYTNIAGSGNTAVGANALNLNTTGGNTAFGYNALQNTTIGSNNTAIGSGAGNNNTTGSQNTAVGDQSMYNNTIGQYNTALGTQAMFFNTTGARNTAVGNTALQLITTGIQNTAVGMNAGATGTRDVTTGTNITLLGYNATSPTQNENNTIVLGNSSVAKIYAQVTTITALSSDARDKTGVDTIPIGLDFINKLRPVKFKYDSRDRYENGVPDGSKADAYWTTGFIAQEVMAVQPDWFQMAYELGEDRLTACPSMVLMPLLKAVQELSAKVTALEALCASAPTPQS